MRFCASIAICLCLVLGAGAGKGDKKLQGQIAITVYPDSLHAIHGDLFGQFLERASFGEPGPEAVYNDSLKSLPPGIMAMLHAMEIPVIRFPGGTDVDYMDWRDLIDSIPGGRSQRPDSSRIRGNVISNRFGIHEYFALRDSLRAKTILVVNLLDALSKKKTLDSAALRAAGLVAYVNAHTGDALPAGMPDWPSIRAANGHPAPFGCEYIQVGNEWHLGPFKREIEKATGLKFGPELYDWYLACLKAYVKAIRSVDPDIGIIFEGYVGDHELSRLIFTDSLIHEAVRYATYHCYAPGNTSHTRKNRKKFPPRQVAPQWWWYGWTAMPGEFNEQGENIAFGDRSRLTDSLGYVSVSTEWNWNGWGFHHVDSFAPYDHYLASTLGAAGFLNGLLRSGDRFKIACQSMLVGVTWDIAAIKADPEGSKPPHYSAQILATNFYRHNHGGVRLRSVTRGSPTVSVPVRIGWAPSKENVALIDAVATADADTIYIHIINRHPHDTLPVTIDMKPLYKGAGPPKSYQGKSLVLNTPDDDIAKPGTPPYAVIRRVSVAFQKGEGKYQCPAHSVSVVKIPRL